MKKKKTNITHTLNLNGREMTFKFTVGSDGRLLYRPTKEELDINPRLKILHKKRLSDMLDAITELFSYQSPEQRSNLFFNDEFLKFLKEFKQRGTKPNRPSTYANVEFVASHYITPYFENLLIKDVNISACNKMISSLLMQGYSKSIIDKAYMYTNEFLEYLVYDDVIAKNPLKKVPKPTPENIETARKAAGKKEKGRHYLNNDEIEKIRDVIYNGYYVKQKSKAGKEFSQKRTFSQPEVYDLLLNTGLRTGELLALKFEYWDQKSKTLDIRFSQTTYIERDENGTGKIKTTETNPKNTTSKTVLKLTDKANEILCDLLKKEPDGYTGYIVHDKDHNPIKLRAFEGRLERIIKAAGIEDVTPHDFRHTFASVLYEQSGGNIQYIKTKMRHKDATTTENIYIDLRKEKEEELDSQIAI